MSEKMPFIIHPFVKGPAKLKELADNLGTPVCAIFQPKEDPKFSTQVETIDKPGKYLISVLGKLQWLEAVPA